MKKLIATLIIGFNLNSFAQMAPPPSSQCSAEELNAASRAAEEATLSRVNQDLLAQGVIRVSGTGADEQDCLRNARQNAELNGSRAIEQCHRNTTYFGARCKISDFIVTQQPIKIVPFVGNGVVDLNGKHVAEAQCKQAAQDTAIQKALNSCRVSTNSQCSIVSGPTPASYQLVKKKKFGIVDTRAICTSRAEALPPSSVQFFCSVDAIAKVRF